MTSMQLTDTIRILCADDHSLVRKGITAILSNEPDMMLVAEASNGREAVEQYRVHRPDVTLMDLRMPELDGTAAVIEIRKIDPQAKIIALTSYDGDHDIYRALEAGVRGYLLKEMVHTEVLSAIRIVNSGGRLLPQEVADRLIRHFPQDALTPREVEVLTLAARGMTNKQIAEVIGTASGTAKMHMQNILSKLDATDRTQAVTIGLERGIIRL